MPSSNITTFFGVDPGVKGAIGWITPTGATALSFERNDPIVLAQNFPTLLEDERGLAVVEAPQPVPKEGANTIARLNRSVGFWWGVFAAHKIPVVLVRPQDWKRKVFFGRREGKDRLDKDASLDLA